jgi:hypothetical protein
MRRGWSKETRISGPFGGGKWLVSSERRRSRPLIAAKAVHARFEKAIRALPIMRQFQSTGVTKR